MKCLYIILPVTVILFSAFSGKGICAEKDVFPDKEIKEVVTEVVDVPAEIPIEPPAIRVKKNMVVSIDYTLLVDGNKVIKTTLGQTPLMYIHGKGQLLPSLEKKLEGLKVGDRKIIILGPEEAYGEVRDEFIREVPKDELPEKNITKGESFTVKGESNEPVICSVVEVKDNSVVLDFNHPLAGKTLEYRVKVVDIMNIGRYE